ncbi:hypothetical protein C5S36_09140 [Candidatus Methanophagaceae archaeon]|nr:hypothetical protein C5S36_09140 [Methanophagales archaeon]
MDIETENETGANIAIAPLVTDGLKLAIENGWVSYSYGTKVEAPVVNLFAIFTKSSSLLTRIADFTRFMPSPTESKGVTWLLTLKSICFQENNETCHSNSL